MRDLRRDGSDKQHRRDDSNYLRYEIESELFDRDSPNEPDEVLFQLDKEKDVPVRSESQLKNTVTDQGQSTAAPLMRNTSNSSNNRPGTRGSNKSTASAVSHLSNKVNGDDDPVASDSDNDSDDSNAVPLTRQNSGSQLDGKDSATPSRPTTAGLVRIYSRKVVVVDHEDHLFEDAVVAAQAAAAKRDSLGKEKKSSTTPAHMHSLMLVC